MKYLELGIELSDELALKSIIFHCNETGIEGSARLLRLLAIALLKSIEMNKEDIELQDILFKNGISIEKDNGHP